MFVQALFVLCIVLLSGAVQAEGSPLQRESSYPYLSGDTFRFFADWHLSTEEYFPPEEVQLGDIIFVEHNYLSAFEREYLSRIAFPVVLLTPYCEFDSDIALPGMYESLAESEKIGCWFVLHLDRPATERILPIPIGICNKIHAHGDIELFSNYVEQARDIEKIIYVFANFRLSSNQKEREPCWNYFKQQSFTTFWFVPIEEGGDRQVNFWDDMSRSKFVVCPPGAGVDTFRTWEALLMDCYPIVKSSFLNPLYEELPVVIVEDWEEVTRDLLESKLEEFRGKKFALEKLYAPYWFDKIRATQKKNRGSGFL